MAAYKRGGDPCAGKVHFITSRGDGSINKAAAGCFRLPAKPEDPWVMPRSESQGALQERIRGLRYRLSDWGYSVSTGPLVWNRHKTGLRDGPGKRRYPLVWAESVRSDGRFEFRAKKCNHKPYFEPGKDEQSVVTDFACVLVQRTTAKEQCRRLIAAELPPWFLKEHGAVVVENHLNMVKPRNGTPDVAPAALAVVLNSEVADQVFRWINGSVAVSAYELGALPLPAPEGTEEIEELAQAGAAAARVRGGGSKRRSGQRGPPERTDGDRGGRRIRRGAGCVSDGLRRWGRPGVQAVGERTRLAFLRMVRFGTGPRGSSAPRRAGRANAAVGIVGVTGG